MTGLLAWGSGQPGQVGNQAALTVDPVPRVRLVTFNIEQCQPRAGVFVFARAQAGCRLNVEWREALLRPMKYLLWLLKAVIFFTLFAFALNNQRDVTVHFFFGTQWNTPLVLVVLLAFSAGVIVGIVGMVPRWWKHRKAAQRAASQEPAAEIPATNTAVSPEPAFKAEPLPPHGI